MDVKITKENLISVLKNVEIARASGSKSQRYRAAGVLEGILYTLGEVLPSETFEFKQIEYIEIGWLGRKRVKTRRQTYIELMVERIEEIINKIN
jgi:hypothetical protein